MTTTRKLEVTEPGGFLHGRDKYFEGDIRVVEEPWASEFIRLGWAKDAATGEQGIRVPGAQVLEVQDTVQTIGG